MDLNAPSPVGASLLAMVVNDDEGCLDVRGVLTFIASRLAPTVDKETACKLSQSGGNKRGWHDMDAHWPGSQPWIDCSVWGARTH
ncbi:hypothetical protein DKY63_18560 [Pseudomonas putida]|uniref:Uncharacterized protein n=1 Tax=Pseudomonas putida TaxID=303 RepID=A0A2Z4RKZ4_PSEPU|nr:hypothetical protein DKY63_18560 [Pseudomonas putida]